MSDSIPFALADLEFDGVRRLLAARTRTPVGETQARRLLPSADPETVAGRQSRLREILTLAQEGFGFPLPILSDPGADLDRLRIAGAVLEPEGLRNLERLAAGVEQARGELKPFREQAPALTALLQQVPDLGPFRRAARGVFTAEGGIDDRASPRLASLRRQIAAASERLRRRLARLVAAPEAGRYLQDEYVTLRNGRFVIPVRADSRAAVEGIVHGTSASGATLFVEPLDTVALNNDLVRLQDEERAEVQRILAELSDAARRQRPDLEAAAAVTGEMDLLSAAERLARDYEATAPATSADGGLELRDVRHALLEERLRHQGGRAVPISLALGDEHRVVVISGPNTGGKTVALKTIGLAALMHQAGLAVPARQACLPVFRQVLADIGDHQSIAEDLSTFSSHVTALARMTGTVNPPSLVLIDELGTGTDPEEGAALGIAVVEFFRRREALVMVTTHHNGLKAYAETTDGVRNAAVEFDEATLRPTYRLLWGVAGRSGGLDIASRLGLAPEIIEAARACISESGRTAQEYLSRLADLAAAATDERSATRREREAAAAERARAEDERRRARGELQSQLRDDLEAARKGFDREAREVLARLEALVGRERARQEAERARSAFSRAVRRQEPARPGSVEAAPAATPGPVGVGDAVWLPAFHGSGIVERVDGERVGVRLAGKLLVVRAADVRRLAADSTRRAAPAPVRTPEVAEVAAELHLIGRRVEEALGAVDRYLDSAVRGGRHEVRVIHGHGTGRLKKAVRAHLTHHPLVERFRPGAPAEGGDGATVVRLRD